MLIFSYTCNLHQFRQLGQPVLFTNLRESLLLTREIQISEVPSLEKILASNKTLFSDSEHILAANRQQYLQPGRHW